MLPFSSLNRIIYSMKISKKAMTTMLGDFSARYSIFPNTQTALCYFNAYNKGCI